MNRHLLDPLALRRIRDAIATGEPIAANDLDPIRAALSFAADCAETSSAARRALRDAALVEIATEFFPTGSARQRAAEIVVVLHRYAASGWKADRQKASNPHAEGTLAAALWRCLRAQPTPPRDRHVRKIIAGHTTRLIVPTIAPTLDPDTSTKAA